MLFWDLPAEITGFVWYVNVNVNSRWKGQMQHLSLLSEPLILWWESMYFQNIYFILFVWHLNDPFFFQTLWTVTCISKWSFHIMNSGGLLTILTSMKNALRIIVSKSAALSLLHLAQKLLIDLSMLWLILN